MEKQLTAAGRGSGAREALVGDPGAGRDRVERGYFIACPRTWRRIRIEFTAGASAAWLSARYGPAERTIAARAKAEGWRKIDIARLRGEALAAEDAAEAEVVRLETEMRARGGGAQTERGTVDLVAARRVAQAKAVAALERDDARAAQDYLKLAQMLDGVGGGEEGLTPTGGRTPQHEAALAVILEKLGVEG